jgi:3-dehydroquinate synthase
MRRSVQIQTARGLSKYEILISNGGLLRAREFVSDILGDHPKKIAIISNKKVFSIYGEDLVQELTSSQCPVVVYLIGDGERFKSFSVLETTVDFLAENKISRTDCVIALGGGVVGDLAGFAASVYLRGISFIQIPTTLLAMIDSSVGGKTGINSGHGKNLIGAFYQPRGVLIDASTLATLPDREITCGLCEAVKHGILSGYRLFNKTKSLIGDVKFDNEFDAFLAAQIKFKAKIVSGDPNEDPSRSDQRSRKILNFGHTFAHALEKVTDYKYLKHGEAVGHGIVFAVELSKKLGILDESVVNLLRGVVHRIGPLPSLEKLDRQQVFESLKRDKKVIDGTLQWVLLNGIGKPVIFPHSKLGDALVKETIHEVISQ